MTEIKSKKPLKEKGVKSLDDFNAFTRDISKDVIETLLDEALTDFTGQSKTNTSFPYV